MSPNSDAAGYRVVDSAGITSFGATVTVPTISCPSSGTYSGYLSTQVVGATVSGGDFVHMYCTAGTARYRGFIVFTTVTTGVKHFAVAPGNTLQFQITVSVNKRDVTHVHASVANKTTGKLANLYAKYIGVATDTTAWDIFEHTGKALVPPFTTTVSWTGARSNGLTLQAASAKHYNMIETGTLLVSASALGLTGASFTNKFHASA